jgi:hypothetical protein
MDHSAIISNVKHLLKTRCFSPSKHRKQVAQQHSDSPEDLISLHFMNLAFVIKVKNTVAALSSFEALGSVQI